MEAWFNSKRPFRLQTLLGSADDRNKKTGRGLTGRVEACQSCGDWNAQSETLEHFENSFDHF